MILVRHLHAPTKSLMKETTDTYNLWVFLLHVIKNRGNTAWCSILTQRTAMTTSKELVSLQEINDNYIWFKRPSHLDGNHILHAHSQPLFPLLNKMLKHKSTAFQLSLFTSRAGADELDSHRGSFISSQANIAGSSEYLTPLKEFFLVTIAWNKYKPKKLIHQETYNHTIKWELFKSNFSSYLLKKAMIQVFLSSLKD